MQSGREIGIRIDQTLTQDATGTLVMLELESMGLDRVRTELSAQYVDHNLVQEDFKNADDHLFLRSACVAKPRELRNPAARIFRFRRLRSGRPVGHSGFARSPRRAAPERCGG